MPSNIKASKVREKFVGSHRSVAAKTIKQVVRSPLSLAIKLALFAGATTAFSASAQEAATTGKTDDSKLERIEIRAQKRTQSVQDVPVAVTAIYGNAMREKGIDTIGSVAGEIANFELFEVSGAGVPIAIIRGVGTQDAQINNTPTAAFYVDEVYQVSNAQGGFTMFDLDMVEVLKGPQGGLYGRNTTGGAILLRSARPHNGDSDGYSKAGFGSFGKWEVEGAKSLSIGESGAVRFSGRIVGAEEGYWTLSDGNDWGAEDRWGARMIYNYEGDDLGGLLKIHGGADKSETPPLRAVGIWAPIDAGPMLGLDYRLPLGVVMPGEGAICGDLLAGQRSADNCWTVGGVSENELGLGSDPHKSASSANNHLDNSWYGVSLNLNWQTESLNLTSITAYDYTDYSREYDIDAIPDKYQQAVFNAEITTWSQEFRLSNNSDELFWQLGASYAFDEIEEVGDLFATRGLVPVGFGTNAVQKPYLQKTSSAAIYGQVDWALSDNLSWLSELRYTEEEKDFSYNLNLVVGESPDGQPVFFNLINVDDVLDFSSVSGKTALNWRFDDHKMAYASISRGFKSGGFYGGMATTPSILTPYNEEVVLAYELGFKTDWPEQDLRFNGAVFYYDYKDQQGFAMVQDPSGAINRQLTNIGDISTLGLELDMVWYPVDNWSWTANLGYLDSEIKDSPYTTRDSFGISDHSMEGLQLPNFSDWNLGVSTRYELELGDAYIMAFDWSYRWRSDFDLSMVTIDAERPLYEEDAYGLMNAFVSLMPQSDQWQASLWVRNLTDEKYRTTARNDSLGGFYELYGATRTFGATFTYKW